MFVNLYEGLLYDDTDRANLAEIRSEMPKYLIAAKEAMALSYAQKPEEATLLYEQKIAPIGNTVNDCFNKTEQYNEVLTDKLKQQSITPFQARCRKASLLPYYR